MFKNFKSVEVVWTISNILSLIRLLLSIPIYFFLINNHNIIVLILFFLVFLTDIGDGYFARKYNQITEFGKILDPIADKVCAISVLLILFYQQRLPLWFIIIIISKDLIILLGGLILMKKNKTVPPSNYFGKYAALFTGLTFIVIVAGFSNEIVFYFFIFTSFLILNSFITYLQVFFFSMKK